MSADHLIVLHGHDDNPEAFAMIAEAMAPNGWTVSVPTGPIETPNGAGWFRIDADHAPDSADVLLALTRLDEVIADAAEGLDGDRSQVTVAGFSQGGALALIHLLRAAPSGEAASQAAPIGALVVIAGWLPTVDRIDLDPARARRRVGRVLVAHGADDEVVPQPLGRSVFKLLDRHGAAVTFIDRPAAHDLTSFVAPVRDWLGT